MLKNKKNLIFGGVIAIVAAGFIVNGYFLTPADNIEPTPGQNVVQDATPTPVQAEEPFSGLNGIKSPATCQIGGEVDFYDKDTFSSMDSKISWQNVDSQGRLINWRISPADNLKIGPNLFANLTIPDGEYENLTVRLPENPISKNYLLIASITYGQFIQGDLKVKETNCIGQVKVNLNF